MARQTPKHRGSQSTGSRPPGVSPPDPSDSSLPGWASLFTSQGADRLATVTTLLAGGATFATAGKKLRSEGVPPDEVSATLTQIELRQKARSKFGATAARLLFTPAGLEQATRDRVAAQHAHRFARAGCRTVADLGCGIGAESLALQAAGVGVLPVERDAFTAQFAAHNLATEVLVADAEQVPIDGVDGAFLDPARRTSGHRDTRRLTSVDDYSPSLSFAFGLTERMPTGVKLGPGFERELIPEMAEAQWVSCDGHVVEMGLWFGSAARSGVRRAALVLSGDQAHELTAEEDSPDPEARELGAYLYEPDGAVIRARLIGRLANDLGAGLLSERIAYLTGDHLVASPFATAFRVVEQLPVREKELRKALAAREIGSLEIKKRGADVEPAELRSRLRLKGPHRATLVLTRSEGRHVALLAERCTDAPQATVP